MAGKLIISIIISKINYSYGMRLPKIKLQHLFILYSKPRLVSYEITI